MFSLVRIGLAAFIFVAVAWLPGFGMTPALAVNAVSAGGAAFSEQAVRVRGSLISIDVVNAPIAEVLAKIAQKAGMDIVSGEGVTGEITLKLTEATLEEVLKSLCRSRALVYEYLPELGAYRIVRALALGETGEKGTAASAAPVKGSPAPGGSATEPEGTAPRQTVAVTSTVPEEGQKGEPGFRDPSGGVGDLSQLDSQGRPLYMKGELLVKIRAGADVREVEALHRALGSTVLGVIAELRLQRVGLREGLAEDDALALYRASSVVQRAGRHALRYPEKTANDTYLGLQWGLAKIAARQAWEITTGKSDVIVAVIDTGVDYNHVDLRDNIWVNEAERAGGEGVDDDGNGYVDDIRGWDFAGAHQTTKQLTVADNNPMDVAGHGTHVSGIIAATGNNGLGVSGVNWRVRIMPLKVQADDGNIFPTFAVVDAMRYAVAKGAKIVNCSYGGGAYEPEELDALTALKNAGGLAICAAGNIKNTGENRDNDLVTHYPSGYDLDNIIAVAAGDSNDALASFSHYGETTVDLMAPGVAVYSTILEGSQTTAMVRVNGSTPVGYAALGLDYAGQTGENGISATAYDCGKGYENQFPPAVAGNIALIQRGTLTFATKVANAQTAGAIGVVIYNDVVDDFDTYGGTLGGPGYWLPAVSVTEAIGEAIVALGTPALTLTNKPLSIPYGNMSGTSFAAPHVTGVAALLRAQCPNLTYAEIRSAILSTVDPISSIAPASATPVASGGRLNAYAALKSLVKPADLNGDCRIDLADAIIALKMVAGDTVSGTYPCEACGGDATGDHRIGMEEVVFILQTAGGLR